VPYRGGGPAAADLLAGHVPVGVLNISGQLIEYHRAGRIRILAVTTAKRAASAPEISTAIESGLPEMVALNFAGLFVPAATPVAAVERIANALRAAVADKAMTRLLVNSGQELSADDTPDKARRFVESEIARWSPMIRSIGLKPG
jgi:tripartite-type tricarboxylate transporter receptor subunit TctC